MKRILVVKLAGLGDVLLTTPGLRALRNAYPSAWIGALVTPVTSSILRGSDTVDEIISFDKWAFDRPAAAAGSLPSALDLARRLRGGRWDAVVLFHHLTTPFGIAKFAALCLTSGAPVRAGLDNGRGWFLTHRAHDGGFGSRHEVDHWLTVAATMGGWNERPRLELVLTDQDRAWAAGTLERLGRDGPEAALIHPGSGAFSTARRWPAERFATVADELDGRYGLHPLVLYGPAAGELELATAVAGGRHDLVGPAPSPQALAALLERARLFVGNDNGTLHLAAAVGTPTVAIFGPSNHLAWGPYPPGSAHQAIVRETLACSPCIYRGHSLGTPEGCPARTCLDLVEPDQVLAAVERVLAPGISSTGSPSADIVEAR